MVSFTSISVALIFILILYPMLLTNLLIILASTAIINTEIKGLKQQKLISSQFWRLEVQDQGAEGWCLGRVFPWDVDGCLPAVSSRDSAALKERKQAVSCLLRGHKCYQVGAPLLGAHVTFTFGHAKQCAGS